MRHRILNLTLLAGLAAAGLTAQSSPKVFDVSTVKPNAANDFRVMLSIQPGGRFTATGVTLKLLISEAYNVRDFQITGGPKWIETDKWDIVAKSEGVTGQIPIDEFRPMLRALIEERFHLKVQHETKEMPVYVLTVAKNGPKLTESSEKSAPLAALPGMPPPPPPPGAEPGAPPRPQGPMMRMGRGQLDARKVPIKMLLQPLSQTLGRTVIDKTDLKGDYDFTLKWTPELGQGGGFPGGGAPPPDAPPAGDSGGPSIFTAVQEQLGLRLDSQKGPVEMLVIDQVEKPSDN